MQVSCQIQSTVQNTEISVLFSAPIDVNSVTSTTFRVVNVDNGTTPVGEYFLDPNDPRRVIFRPALTFDLNGTPSFGFLPDTPYQITIAGQLQSATGPYIRSTAGRPNQSRLDCTIVTTDEITDPVPGPPVVKIYADYVTAYTAGVPTTINRVANAFGEFDGFGTDGLTDNLVNGPNIRTDVLRTGTVYMLFQDVMNPATLANPISMTAPFITIRTDEDGNLSTTIDRSDPVNGSYRVSVDTELLQTLLTFTPATSFLSAGGGYPTNPRYTVVDIPPSCLDLDLNGVTPANGGGLRPFVTEPGVVTEIELPRPGGETFADASGEDSLRSGGLWGTANRLRVDVGGGSGRLGELIVGAGETIVLNTDSQSFPISGVADLIGNPDMFGAYPTTITVTDGVFEFSVMTVQPGGTLRLEGSNPARILVRGEANIAAGSLVDLSGESAGAHSSTVVQPEVELGPAAPVPAGAGAGGWGGDRYDFGTPSVFLAIGGVDVPDTVPANNDGRDGGGVGGSSLAAGKGGLQNPSNFPTVNVLNVVANPPSVPVGAHGAGSLPNFNWNVVVPGFVEDCPVKQVGISGSGGGYALNGGTGLAPSPQPLSDSPPAGSNAGPNNPGGLASDLNLNLEPPSEANAGYAVRTLDHTLGGAYPGYLRGGSGGGGGGNHMFETLSTASFGVGCAQPGTVYQEWRDHSGARGGGGGGALHIAAGKNLILSGQIDLRGGNGGSSNGLAGSNRFAMPGGGGSGGAFRAQAKSIVVSPLANRILITGGNGGTGAWSNGMVGGNGSVGLVRFENNTGSLLHQVLAPSIDPYLGDGTAPFDDVDKSLDFLSVANGAFQQSTSRPDSICASVSCWIELPSQYSTATFAEDGAELGWDMDVIWQVGANPETQVPYRAMSGTFPLGFEGTFGNHLGTDGGTASPVVVRFQGARVGSALPNPCNVSVNSGSSPIQFGSLTPWVSHPAELNVFGPNIIRYVVLFDNTVNPGAGDTPGNTLANVKGITNLSIRAAAE